MTAFGLNPTPISRRSFTTRQLVETLPEVISALRDPANHARGRINSGAIDAADAEFATLYVVADTLGLDMTGIPTYRVGGWVRGMSPRTKPIHVRWVVADVLDRLVRADSGYVHAILWEARARSIRVSRDAASIMLSLIEADIEDEFAAFRDTDAA